MKRIFTLILALAVSLTAAPAAFGADSIKVRIDTADINPLGEFEGWGTSLCWWAEVLGSGDEALRREFDKALFSPDGLGLNIARYNIGAGDAPGHNHMRDGGSVPAWQDENGSFDPSADSSQLAVLKDAVEFGADTVELFSNSPPYYLTESGCSGGGHDPGKNNISPSNFGKFADYLAKVAAYIHNDMGIKVSTVEPMNEPATNFWGYEGWQEGCHIDPEDHSALILALRKSLDEKGLKEVGVSASDENSVSTMVKNLDIYTDEAINALSQINAHTYNGASSGAELNKKAAELNKKLYMSETDGDGSIGYDSGEMGPALWLSQRITYDMNNMRPNAWVLWQAAPAWPGEAPDSGYWNICQFDKNSGKIDLFKKYYAYGHYTKFIKKGDRILKSGRDNVLAARNFTTGKTVLVISNWGKWNDKYEIDLSAFENLGNRVRAYRTDNSANMAEINDAVLENKVLKAEIPKNSITTVVIENEAPAEVKNAGIKLELGRTSLLKGEKIEFTSSASEDNAETESLIDGIPSDEFYASEEFAEAENKIVKFTVRIKGSDISASEDVHYIGDGSVVRIENVNSGLNIQENPDEGYKQCAVSDSAYQYWTVRKNGEELSFENLRSKKCLADGDGNIIWKIQPEDKGWGIINAATGKCLDAYGFSTAEDSTVGTYEYGGGANQLWNFRLSSPEKMFDETKSADEAVRIVPASVNGTAPYGGNEDVSYEKAFDGNVKTHHDAWDASNSYLEADMPPSLPVNMIRFYPREGFAYRMAGGKFYGVKDGAETLLYTVPEKINSGWNEARIDNDVIYDKIIYRTPEGGLCNVAELEFWNNDLDVEFSVSGNNLKLKLKNYGGGKNPSLVLAYRTPGTLTAVETHRIAAESFAEITQSFELSEKFETVEVYLTEDGEIIESGYIYLKGNEKI